MAVSKNNVVTNGLSGLVGDMLVFRNYYGKTIVSSKPKERTVNPSVSQQAHTKKFQEAILYAKAAVKNPQTMEIYEQAAKNGLTPYNIAIADFFHAPDIKMIDLSEYTGKLGDLIRIQVVDYEVKEVVVTIINPDGTEVEHGNAQYSELTGNWEFRATATNTSLDGDKIIVTATDIPGNIGMTEEVLA